MSILDVPMKHSLQERLGVLAQGAAEFFAICPPAQGIV
jgi:hypothetical protein